MDLENAAQMTIILGFFGGIFSHFILKPLNNAITELRAVVQEIRTDLRNSNDRRHEMEIKLAEVDQRARSAHHRLDDLVEICEKTHNMKVPRSRD